MKASDLRPCDVCGGPLLGADVPAGFDLGLKLTFERHVLDRRALKTTLGLVDVVGGSLQLAEVFSPQPRVTTTIEKEAGEELEELLVCRDCVLSEKHNLFQLYETAMKRCNKETDDDE